MKRGDVFPSTYLKAADVQTPLQLTIKKVQFESLFGEDEDKPVMSFKEHGSKSLVLNKTNWDRCELLYGEDSDDWLGKPVMFHVETAQFQGKDTPSVRVDVAATRAAAAFAGPAPTKSPVPSAAAPSRPPSMPPKPPVPQSGSVPKSTSTQDEAWQHFLSYALAQKWDEATQNAEWFKLLDKTHPGKAVENYTGADWNTLIWAMPTKGLPF